MISEISNEIFLFFFFDSIFSSRVSSACVFLFLCFFHKMQVHPLDSEQDNHILPFPTASLRHSILSFVSTGIAECLHKMVPSHQDYPRVFRNISEGAIFILRKISKKLPRFSEYLREMFSFLQDFLDFFPQCPPFLLLLSPVLSTF